MVAGIGGSSCRRIRVASEYVSDQVNSLEVDVVVTVVVEQSGANSKAADIVTDSELFRLNSLVTVIGYSRFDDSHFQISGVLSRQVDRWVDERIGVEFTSFADLNAFIIIVG